MVFGAARRRRWQIDPLPHGAERTRGKQKTGWGQSAKALLCGKPDRRSMSHSANSPRRHSLQTHGLHSQQAFEQPLVPLFHGENWLLRLLHGRE